MQTMDLSSEWQAREDPADEGVREKFYAEPWLPARFVLPGSACENGVGQAQPFYDRMTPETVRAPREPCEFIGPLWLRRTVTVPEDFAGMTVRLFLERVNMASALWLDGEAVGGQVIELSAPHVHDLAVKLYKEDIEAALRTEHMGGFELLSLCDLTGQCTATVGVLDAFHESKGLIAPEQFRAFCGPVVPLFWAKRSCCSAGSI